MGERGYLPAVLSSRRPLVRHRVVGAALAAAALLAIGVATLTPLPGAPPVVAPRLCVFCGELGGTDFILNVLLFIPLGAALRLAGLSRVRVVLVAALATLTVESLQFLVITGRDASLGDLLSNALGGALGALLLPLLPRVLLPSPAWSARLAVAAAAVWLAIVTVTAFSGALWSPGPELLFRRAPLTSRWGWYPGRVLEVRSPQAVVDESAGDGYGRHGVRSDVPAGGPVRLTVITEVGGVVGGRAAIATIVDAAGDHVAVLGQRRRDLIFRVRTAGARAKVRVPGLTISGLFAPRDERAVRRGWPVAGDTVRIEAEYVGRQIRLRASWRGGTAVREATVHPFVGWSYLVPWDYSYGPWTSALSAMWAGGLVVPAAYWAGRARRSVAERAAVAGLVAVGLLVVPAAAGTGAAPAPVLAGVAGAAAAAFALGVAFGRLRQD